MAMNELQYLISLLFLYSFLSFAVPLNDCSKDLDCKKGYYCSQSYCTPSCISCEEVMNRQSLLFSSGEALCAREESDCGDCLPGYQADNRVNGNKSMKCYPLTEGLSRNQPDVDGNLKTINYFLSIAVVAFILAIVLAVLNPKCKVLLSSSFNTFRYVRMKEKNVAASPNFKDTTDQDELNLFERKSIAADPRRLVDHPFEDGPDSLTV